MKNRLLGIILCGVFTISFSQRISDDCTSILVTKGASQDGSVMITYACDAEFLPQLKYTPAADHAENVVTRWIGLGEHLITKYNDGYVKDENGKPKGVGYPESWLRGVIKSKPGKFKLKEWK